MADQRHAFWSNKTFSTTGAQNGDAISTAGKRSFVLMVDMDALGGSSANKFDCKLEECENSDFSPSTKVRTLASISQIAGDGSSGSGTQKVEVSDVNVDRHIRAVATITTSAADFTNVNVAVLYDEVP